MALGGFLKGKIEAPHILRLMWLWTVFGLVAFAFPFFVIYWPLHNGYDPRGYVFGRDFVNVWLGAKLMLEGKVDHLYNVPVYLEDLYAAFGHMYPTQNFSYPPHILVLIAGFGGMPYFLAFAAWTLGGIAALMFAIRANRQVVTSWYLPVLAALSPAVWTNAVSGQNGAFTAAFFLGGLYLCEASPVAAGMLFGMLTVKPHLGILIPFVLLIRRNWKCIGSAIVTAAVLTGASFAMWGADIWEIYLTQTASYQKMLLDMLHGFYPKMMPSIYTDARVVLLMSPGRAMVLQVLAAAWAFATAIPAVKRDGVTARTVAMLAVATLIILPYDFNYDMVMVSGSLIIYLATLAEISVRRHLVFGMLWALPTAIFAIKNIPGLPISSVTLILSLACLHLQGKRDEASSPRKGGVLLLWPWSIVALGAYVSPFITYYLPTCGLLDINRNIIGDDFVNVWFGARLARLGDIATLYSPGPYFEKMQQAIGETFNTHNFSYLPNILPLIFVFGLLPYIPSLLLWTAAGLSALVAAIRHDRFADMDWKTQLLVVLSPASILNAVGGQNGAFTAALFLGGLFTCDTSPLFAGVLFGLLTVKPHLGILIPFVLIIRRNWKCFGAAVATALALAGISTAIWGVDAWNDYIQDTLPFQMGLLQKGALTPLNMFMPGPFADLTTVAGLDALHAIPVWICIALLSAVWVLQVVAREGLTPRSILMLALATLVIIPYGFEYDMVGVSAALAIYAAAEKNISRVNRILLGLLWITPPLLFSVKLIPMPVSSVVMVAALAGLYCSKPSSTAAAEDVALTAAA